MANREYLQKEICYVKGVGPRRAELLAKLGIYTVKDLLEYYPRDYLDLTKTVAVASASYEEKSCILARVLEPATERIISGGRKLYTLLAHDGKSPLRIVFFNAAYTASSLKKGASYLFYGKVGGTFSLREMISPQIFEPAQQKGFLPIYGLTAGITNKTLTTLVQTALAGLPAPLQDSLPSKMVKEYNLMDTHTAVNTIHFPKSLGEMQAARRRLIFEELLVLRLGMWRLKGVNRGITQIGGTKDFTPEFWQSLPFTPTNAQRRVTDEAMADMEKKLPMSRLVQGDVGSGKTAVAAALCHSVALNGYQCAVMAPTEILANQHYETFTSFLQPFGITVGLLTGSMKVREKRQVLEGLANGSIQVAVGTHALLQDTVSFQNLGLVITDEQHRFGVAQRARLSAKGEEPHLLVMSATPIPRTLAMMMYGDLDVSVLDERPKGRKPVDTYAVPTSYRPRVYEYIRKFLREGQQAYVVCPLVEEGEETSNLISAEEYQKQLTTVFPEYTVGLLHGKMKPKEKEKVMGEFATGHIHVLVATTVVEVGVDVPNANIMVVENAERFGLSQLHQLRGRVGRGSHEAACVLVSDAKGEFSKQRMGVLKATNDGFQIADEDLKLRGPGDFFGDRQHGLPQLKLADLLTDTRELHLSAKAASGVLDVDPALARPEHRGLKLAVEKLHARVVAP